eukprot:1760314-Rhodomonas_salina.2
MLTTAAPSSSNPSATNRLQHKEMRLRTIKNREGNVLDVFSRREREWRIALRMSAAPSTG